MSISTVVSRPVAFPPSPSPPPSPAPQRHSEEILLGMRSIRIAIGRLIGRRRIIQRRSNTFGRMHLMEVSCTRVVAPDRGSRRDAFQFKETRIWQEERQGSIPLSQIFAEERSLRWKSILPSFSMRVRRAFAARRELSGDLSRPAARLNKTESRAWRNVRRCGR